MDPVSCLDLAESAMSEGNRDEVCMHLDNLAEWVRRGGFMDERGQGVWNERMQARWEVLAKWLWDGGDLTP